MHILKSVKTNLNNDVNLLGNLLNKNNILVIGVFHGDEPQGKFLIENYLKSNPVLSEGENNLLFIPCLNPDGMALNKRTNANNVDLNRNFPTDNWELSERDNFFGGECPQSETETNFLVEIIDEYKPKLILTLHTPYKVVNYDGPAEEIAQKISELIGYPVEECIGYPTPGSFGTYCGVERDIPVITLELDENCPVELLTVPVNKIFDALLHL